MLPVACVCYAASISGAAWWYAFHILTGGFRQ